MKIISQIFKKEEPPANIYENYDPLVVDEQ